MKKVYLTLLLLTGIAFMANACYTMNMVEPDITVAADGSGDFTTVQAAIDSIPENNLERTVIFIKNGVYNEQLLIKNKSFISFLGEDRKSTKLTWDINFQRWEAGDYPEAKGRASINLQDSNDLVFDNLTMVNPNRDEGHTFTIYSGGSDTRIIIINSDVIAHGLDTLSLWSEGMYYHKNIYVTGSSHFFGPRGSCYITDSVFNCLGGKSLFNEGVKSKEIRLVIKASKFDGPGPYKIGSYFRDAAWYFIGNSFSDKLEDVNVYRHKDDAYKMKWGEERIYYYNNTGPDYAWLKDNLDQSPVKDPETITAAWTLLGWDPESTDPVKVSNVAQDGDSYKVTFAENVTVKRKPIMRLDSGVEVEYVSGSGTNTLAFKFLGPITNVDVKLFLGNGSIVASVATVKLRFADLDLTE